MGNETPERRRPWSLRQSLRVPTGQILLKQKMLMIVEAVTWVYMIMNAKMVQGREEDGLNVKEEKR